jgi:hypothetical protein
MNAVESYKMCPRADLERHLLDVDARLHAAQLLCEGLAAECQTIQAALGVRAIESSSDDAHAAMSLVFLAPEVAAAA